MLNPTLTFQRCWAPSESRVPTPTYMSVQQRPTGLLATLCINTQAENHGVFQKPFSVHISQGLKPSTVMFSVPQHTEISQVCHISSPSLTSELPLHRLRAMTVCFSSWIKVLKTWAVNSFIKKKNPSRNSTASWQFSQIF